MLQIFPQPRNNITTIIYFVVGWVHFLGKRQKSTVIGCASHMVYVVPTKHSHAITDNYKQWPYLCSNRTLLLDIEIWIYNISTLEIFFFFLFFYSVATKKQAVYQTEPEYRVKNFPRSFTQPVTEMEVHTNLTPYPTHPIMLHWMTTFHITATW
jgi:hypothetical protein